MTVCANVNTTLKDVRFLFEICQYISWEKLLAPKHIRTYKFLKSELLTSNILLKASKFKNYKKKTPNITTTMAKADKGKALFSCSEVRDKYLSRTESNKPAAHQYEKLFFLAEKTIMKNRTFNLSHYNCEK